MSGIKLDLIPEPVARGDRRVGTASIRQAPTRARIERRRCVVGMAKRLLPVVALALLCSIALWPEIARDTDRTRMSFRRGATEAENGQVVDARYNGVDERNHPYTMTAATARQSTPERIDLVEPKGDIQLESGTWLLLQAHRGVFLQHTNQLDLSDEVTLYRDDGTTLQTSSAAIDLKAGAAAGNERVHVEGPFGTLDAQSFVMTDRGTITQFAGPGRLVLNGSGK
jgi:lipopolysaccharide export system protein LptC